MKFKIEHVISVKLAGFLLRLIPGEQVQDLLLAAGDCGKCLHNSASCLSCSLGGRCEKNLQKVELRLAFIKKLHLPVCELTNKANNILLFFFFNYYLSQPVVVAQFKQAWEKAFSFSRPHELLPLPHILLKQILFP